MKIGVYIDEPDPRSGGGFTFEETLCEELFRVGPETRHSFVFIAPHEAKILASARAAGFDTVSVPTKRIGRLVGSTSVALKTFTSSLTRGATTRIERPVDRMVRGFDFLWCLGPGVPSMEVPFLVTLFDLQHRLRPYLPELSSGEAWLRREKMLSIALRRAALVVAGSSVGQQQVEVFYQVPSERIVVAPHPVPSWATREWPPRDALSTGLSPPRPYVLYPAQFWPHKNHISLLRALRVLLDDAIDLHAVFVGGDKGNRSYVEQCAYELGLSERVHILGFVTTDDLAMLYNNATGLVFPSLFGPENLPPLEAFALGTPVVVAEGPGVFDQYGDAALLFDPLDAEAMALSMRQVLEDEDTRRKLIDGGRRIASQRTPRAFIALVLDAIDGFESVRQCWPPA